MSDENNNSRFDSNSISEAAIRRCLLGVAPPAEQARFEELLLIDDEMEKRVRLAEFELADDFSFGRLKTSEHELFTNNFLVTEERRRKLEVSQALRNSLSPPIVEATAIDDRKGNPLRRVLSTGLLRYDRPAVSFGLGLLALVLMGGLLWLVMKSQRVQPPVVVKRPTASSPERESHHPGGTQAPSQPPESTITPTESAAVATLLLRPGVRSDETPSVHFTKTVAEGDTVRLEFLLQANQAATYQAELLTIEGQQIAVASELSPVTADQQLKVVWYVPASLLRVGRYQVNLNRVSGGQTQEVERYNFSVK